MSECRSCYIVYRRIIPSILKCQVRIVHCSVNTHMLKCVHTNAQNYINNVHQHFNIRVALARLTMCVLYHFSYRLITW